MAFRLNNSDGKAEDQKRSFRLATACFLHQQTFSTFVKSHSGDLARYTFFFSLSSIPAG
uniref:Uncharacterized protein n=1 Tax=Loa loa TaxID=7209 RepID=A0A1I7W438_LOALO